MKWRSAPQPPDPKARFGQLLNRVMASVFEQLEPPEDEFEAEALNTFATNIVATAWEQYQSEGGTDDRLDDAEFALICRQRILVKFFRWRRMNR